jgi:hypothetical protein
VGELYGPDEVSKPRRPVEPLLDRLLDGKVPKQIGAEFGVTPESITFVLHRYVKETGCKTLIQAVARYALETNSAGKPPEGVD